jgi:hypothetical protein
MTAVNDALSGGATAPETGRAPSERGALLPHVDPLDPACVPKTRSITMRVAVYGKFLITGETSRFDQRFVDHIVAQLQSPHPGGEYTMQYLEAVVAEHIAPDGDFQTSCRVTLHGSDAGSLVAEASAASVETAVQKASEQLANLRAAAGRQTVPEALSEPRTLGSSPC